MFPEKGKQFIDTFGKILLYAAVALVFLTVGLATPVDVDALGPMTLLPAVFLITYISITKRIVEGLVLSTLLCTVMSDKLGFFSVFNGIVLETMLDENTAWLIIVCGLMGAIVALVEKSGGGLAFGRLVARKAKSEKASLLWTALCSLLLSIDDYMNVLVTGSAMTKVNDQKRVPREMTSYVVASTAAPACVLNPISTWAVFIGGLIIANGLGEKGGQVLAYARTIPYNFYAMTALAVELLVVVGVIPKVGPMKRAYERVAAGGALAPEGSEKIDIRASAEAERPGTPKLRNFFVPMLVLLLTTVVSGFDMQAGVTATLGFCFIWFVAQGMDPLDFVDESLGGMKNMLMPILLMVLAFSFANGCERIGFLDYVVGVAVRNISLPLLPVVVFITFAITEFIMGISWGMYIMALPLVIPITLELGGNPHVTIGAVAAAGVFGAHCCFYSDSTILTSASTGCDNLKHAISQLPYGVLAGVLAVAGYLVVGLTMYG